MKLRNPHASGAAEIGVYLLQAAEISFIEGASKASLRRRKALLLEGNAERVEAFLDEVVDRAGECVSSMLWAALIFSNEPWSRPDVMSSQGAL